MDKLQSELICEKAKLEAIYNRNNQRALEIYNMTLYNNKVEYDNAIRDLTDQYNKLRKYVDHIRDIYNITTFQLNNESNPDIIYKLKCTLDKLPNVDSIDIIPKMEIIEFHDNIHKMTISEKLSKHLIPNIKPNDKGEYTLSLNLSHRNRFVYLSINNENTKNTYEYCIAPQLDLLIVYCNKFRIDQFATAIFIKLSTSEFKVINTDFESRFLFYNNCIMKYNNSNEFIYYIFENNTLDYSIKKVYCDNYIIVDTDLFIYASNRDDTLIYEENNIIYLMRPIDGILTIYGKINLDFTPLDIPEVYRIDILKFQQNTLILECISVHLQYNVFIKVNLESSFILENDIFVNIN